MLSTSNRSVTILAITSAVTKMALGTQDGNFKNMPASYGIISKQPTVKNPMVQSLNKQINAQLTKVLHTKLFEHGYFQGKLNNLLQSMANSHCTTMPFTIKHSPTKLTFGIDPLFCQKVIANWEQL